MKTIKQLINKINLLIDAMLNEKIHPAFLAASFFGIIVLRVFEEKFLASANQTIESVVNDFLYNFFFFSILYLLIWILLSLFLRTEFGKLSGMVIWTFWLMLVPPVIDMIKTGGSVFWSFYALDGLSGLWLEFITFFGHLPSGIVYFGAKIVFILTIVLVAILILLRTKNYLKALAGAFCAYVFIFIMGSLPSWLTMAYYFFEGSKKISEVNRIDIIQFFGSPRPIFGIDTGLAAAFINNLNEAYFLLLVFLLGGIFCAAQRQKTWAVLKNARFPQLIYHSGLLFAGMGIGAYIYPQNLQLNIFSLAATLIMLTSVWLAWEASVIVNDIYDFEIDKISNQARPLQKNIFTRIEYADLGWIFFGLSVLGGLVIGFKFAGLLCVYQILAWFYSAPPYRLKKFPVAATFFSSLASVVVILIGFNLFSGADNIKLFPWRIILLFIVSLTLSLPLKDFKDIEGDRKDGIWTIPVLFGMEIGKTIVATGIFTSFLLSVFILNELDLFWWAMLAGGAAFLIVTNKKTKPIQLFWQVLLVVAIYAMILVKIVFLK